MGIVKYFDKVLYNISDDDYMYEHDVVSDSELQQSNVVRVSNSCSELLEYGSFLSTNDKTIAL